MSKRINNAYGIAAREVSLLNLLSHTNTTIVSYMSFRLLSSSRLIATANDSELYDILSDAQ